MWCSLLFSWVGCCFVFLFVFFFKQNSLCFINQTEWDIPFTSSLRWTITNFEDQKKDGPKHEFHLTPQDKVQFLKGLWRYKGEKKKKADTSSYLKAAIC